MCRIANPTPDKVCEFVHRMPKHKIPKVLFQKIMGKKWFANEHQAPEQWGLYYLDDCYFYPRFNRDITLHEAKIYMEGWLKRLIVINPYTRFKCANDNGLVLSIVKELERVPDVHDFKSIMTSIIGDNEPFIINDILVNTINAYSEVLKIDIIDKDNELFIVNLLPNYKKIINEKYSMTKKEYFDLFEGIAANFDENQPLQQIYYGAPGTGKSWKINDSIKDRSTIRTTFHPDSDYSTFVGAYKPVMTECTVYGQQGEPIKVSINDKKENLKEPRITYAFVKQAFLKAYLSAWQKYAEGSDAVEPQFLVIEEINRGNCAQIFGDLFQLLDRSDNGFSSYPIEADTDLQNEIMKAFAEGGEYALENELEVDNVVAGYKSVHGKNTLSKDIQEGRVLLLPNNLYIWATMNTSDQSLFPIDSAFKRRWDWHYMKIADGGEGWKIKCGTECFDWWTFVEKINKCIAKETSSDDKKLGYFFCKPPKNSKMISEETFVGKVLFYLWNDVFKDGDVSLFKVHDEPDAEVCFDAFYGDDNEVNVEAVRKFLVGVVGKDNVKTEAVEADPIAE